MEQLSQSWSSIAPNVMSDGVTSSLLASFGTGVGALPILFTSRLSERWKILLLSVGSGVMLSAAAFSLLIPALVLAGQSDGYGVGAGEVVGAVIFGAAMFYGLERVLPEPALEQQAQARHIWLFVLAIALHHFPEGLAVGLGTESTHDAGIAIGVALQNLPEGLMVALALRQLGYGIGLSLGLAAVSGWLEPLGGLLGVTLIDLGGAIAPIGMALAAGAMLFVVLHELLPELNLKTLNSSGSVGLMTGLVVMGMVDQFLG
ncbi:MAG: ZIP family metal transporter [Leptolyngbya sp. SIO3F4]|nr:ZIP family metal transporter [Leptolyngbya sp. SIO3F4]